MRSVGGVLISLPQAMSPHTHTSLKSVMHGQYDVRPTVTFPAAALMPLLDRYQIILLGDKGTCANNLLKVVEPVTFQSQVQCPNHYTTRPHLSDTEVY